jgi:hypothetical protein
MAYKDPADQAAAARRHYENNKEKMKARAVAHKAKMREVIVAYLAETKNVPCMDCGEQYPTYVMDFDHVRGEKLFSLANAWQNGFSLKKVQEEVAKCEVVCANCHRIRTWMRKCGMLEL